MKNKKFNPELLKEEIGKFKLLSEYDFYQEKKEIPEYKDLILGDEALDEADEAPADLKPEDEVNAAADNIAADLGVDAGNSDSEESTSDIPEPDTAEQPATPASDDVEVDVTSLVKGSEEAKRAADTASKNSEMLLQKLTDLESRVASMSQISDKIEGLEKELIKRNPTPVEKMEMRSLSSYPFNQKLTDYWADKGGAYDVMGKEKPKEYVLTKDDVDSTYSDANLRKSFSVNDNPYDEETIQDYDEEDI
jgi:hypothetical protein